MRHTKIYSEVQKRIPKNVPSFEPSNNDLHQNKTKQKKRNEKRKEKKQIATGRQILKALCITYCTLKTSIVGYTYNMIMVLSYLTFASFAILLRRGN